ncbi:hypothetical protein N2601_19820 (plasmid) [Rhizobium sp. CB3060]|uniref:hypothetical protein n=1 Tax=Rhizobium sp. CB3060 TaxID=3138255 RepID=UPI0021A8013F|nr:hypothetical protein [Rhizobium tropici]UWU24404.1 hypothetical protein N2601_19820 [Rhizobium tropici]
MRVEFPLEILGAANVVQRLFKQFACLGEFRKHRRVQTVYLLSIEFFRLDDDAFSDSFRLLKKIAQERTAAFLLDAFDRVRTLLEFDRAAEQPIGSAQLLVRRVCCDPDSALFLAHGIIDRGRQRFQIRNTPLKRGKALLLLICLCNHSVKCGSELIDRRLDFRDLGRDQRIVLYRFRKRYERRVEILDPLARGAGTLDARIEQISLSLKRCRLHLVGDLCRTTNDAEAR